MPLAEYQILKTALDDFEALKHALVSAGTPSESIGILIKHARAELAIKDGLDYPFDLSNRTSHSESTTLTDTSTLPSRASPDKQFSSKKAVKPPRNFGWGKLCYPGLSEPSTPTTDFEESCNEECREEINESVQNFKTCRLDRSLVFKGLSTHTTLQEIVKQIKGGMLLNIYMKRQTGSVHVTFVDADAAERFLMHVRKNDLYIKNKRASVSWDEKQRYMTGGIQKQIFCHGATRNLVLRFPKPGVTEQTVRDDLEHIDLLEIVAIQNTGGHFYISTNSVGSAVTARSCMLHRSRYKGSRIEFYPDECAEPMPPIPKRVAYDPPSNDQRGPRKEISLNRFEVLFDEDCLDDS